MEERFEEERFATDLLTCIEDELNAEGGRWLSDVEKALYPTKTGTAVSFEPSKLFYFLLPFFQSMK